MSRKIRFRAWCKKYGDRQYTEWCKAKALRDIWGLNHDQRVDLYQRETGNTYTPVEYWEMDYDPHANDEWASETQPLNPVIDTIVREGDLLMQYAGRRDKNGKEIYEGDIIKKRGRLYDVRFSSGSFTLNHGNHCHSNLSSWHEHELEVIGDVHRNPELLTPPHN